MEVGVSGKECAGLVRAIEERISDFGAAYMALRDLHALVSKHPEVVCKKTIHVLGKVLGDDQHASQKLALFFFKEAAQALAAIPVHENIETNLALGAIEALKSAAGRGGCHARRAAAEAMGSLPLPVAGFSIGDIEPPRSVPCIEWKELLERAGASGRSPATMRGRSLVVSIEEKESLLVVKLNRAKESPRSMAGEAAWMERLKPRCRAFPLRFDIPSPIKIGENFLFRIKDAPVEKESRKGLDTEGHAIGFIAHKDYFTYVNEPAGQTLTDKSNFKEALIRNAWLLGKTASFGVIHSAPIPLFHNRVQVNRRADLGLYEWPRGGRLDRWLSSCRHPNFGLTGLRDFEHFAALTECGKGLYERMGSHFLSLLLVAGSYFRNKEPERIGQNSSHQPVDARELFDGPLLEELICGIFFGYYNGFVGSAYQGELPFNRGGLCSRMIEEMGVDRHMDEILRVADQQNMTDEELKSFLAERGCTAERISGIARGAQDIVLSTGPHLGGFNQRISLPELIEFAAAVSAVCIADKYLKCRKAA